MMSHIERNITDRLSDRDYGSSQGMGNSCFIHHVRVFVRKIDDHYSRAEQEIIDILYDAADKYPDTGMPPYGRHLILDTEELEMVIDFLMDI